MALNDQKICTQIAKKPGCRAVDLADILNCELIDISNALRALVDVGDVVRTAGTGANGQPAQFYHLSDTFLKSREGKLILAHLEASTPAVASAAPLQTRVSSPAPKAELQPAPSAPTSTALVSPVPLPGRAENAVTSAGANRVDLAIAFIRDHGTASDAQLRGVMGLRAGQYPAAWLTYALRDGRVRKSGKEWSLGDGVTQSANHVVAGAPPDDPVKVPEEIRTHLTARVVVADESGRQTEGEAGPLEMSTSGKDNGMPAPFRCALWSDGVLELRRGAEVLAELTSTEQRVIARHLTEGRAE